MLFHKLLKKGYRPYEHNGVNHLKKSTRLESSNFLVRVIDAHTVGSAQIFKHNEEFPEPIIHRKNEELTTVKEVEELYKLAVKKESNESGT